MIGRHPPSNQESSSLFLIERLTPLGSILMVSVSLGMFLMACAPVMHPLSLETLPLEEELIEALLYEEDKQGDHLSSDAICASCHPRQAEEFATSTMRYAFFSPTFNALELTLNQLSGGAFAHPSLSERSLLSEERERDEHSFCSRCHGPRAMAEGLRVDGRSPSRTLLTPKRAQESGIGCDLCHTATIKREPSAGLPVTPSPLKLASHADPSPNLFHRYFEQTEQVDGVNLGDEVALGDSEFCAPCHDVRPSLPDVESGQPVLRSEDLFSEWARSPWADPDHPLNPLRGQTGIRGVHDDPAQITAGERVTCQDCHMSLYPQRRFQDDVFYEEAFAGVDPAELKRKAHKLYPASSPASLGHVPPFTQRHRRVSTHYFTGVSHPLTPFRAETIFELEDRSPDEENERALEWRDQRDIESDEWRSRWRAWRASEALRVDETGSSRAAHVRREELLKAAVSLSLDETPTSVERNNTLRVDAWLENSGAGHNVPAGFSQEREVWLALTVIDEGRSCVEDLDCADLIEAPLFLDSPNRNCSIHDSRGQLDPATPERGSWEVAARAERSGLCGSEGRCILYRSGYLIDHDGDGHLHDEDLRHVLVERDQERFEERCVVSGPDADTRLRGLERGLVHFTNSLQRIEVDERGQPVEHPQVTSLAPTEAPFDPWAQPLRSVFEQSMIVRRSHYPTQRALYEQSRYRPAPVRIEGGVQRGLGIIAPHLLAANRAFNGHALRPFEPRLARYDVQIPAGSIGPLKVEAKLRFRFFSPRILRTLIARHPDLMREDMLDEGLTIIDMATDMKSVSILED